MVQDGATMLDIGGQSTRPGASQVSEDEEINRIAPVLEAIRSSAEFDSTVLSVMTLS